ncbi:WD40/YVTN/BNR-like repeat-containing protein [Candidatus Palauibacter sp.]|uniref:WD40/YVTN/BNR-like repeat-containing protein n=1 Tax=Candidatus Palauibacter sp. TaxID=3101350 RepID=UPI003B52FD9B
MRSIKAIIPFPHFPRGAWQLLPALVLAVPAGEMRAAPLQEDAGAEAQDETSLYQSMRWRNVGPFRGGRAVAAAGVPDDRLTYYMGTAGGGVWKTSDAGISWRPITDGFVATSSVGAVAVSESDPNVVYVGMGEHSIRGVTTSHGDGVYRSTDAGRTWKHMGLAPTRTISRIRVHPENPDLVYVAAQGSPFAPTPERGIYRSADGGENWELVLHVDENTGASDLAMDRTNPRILYASMWDHDRDPWYIRSGGPGSGFWKSTDGGDTWEEINAGLPEMMGKTAIDVSPADPDRVWALIEADEDVDGVYRSDDGGKTWALVSSERQLRGRAWYYIEIYADPLDRETVYVMNSPFLKSIDGGRTWETIQTPHVDHHDLWINPFDGQVMLSANDGGGTVTFNGGETWSTQENQSTAQIYRIAVDNQFPYRMYGGQQDNTSVGILGWATHSGGLGWKDWFDAGGGESAWVAFDPDNPRYLYATSIQGMISELDTELGSSRSVQAYPQFQLGMDAEDMRYRWNWNGPVVVSPHDPTVIYHGAQHLLRSSDRGVTWEEISPDLTRNEPEKHVAAGGPFTNEAAGGEVYNTIVAMAESPLEAGTIWVGADDGLVHITRDDGETWTDVTPEGMPEGMVNSVDPSAHEPGGAYITLARYKFNDFAPYIYRTADYGRSWQRIDGGIASDQPEAWARVVREDPERRGLLFAGTELGMYVSFDDGGSWRSLDLNLPLTQITDLQVQAGDLAVATQGRGFWVLDDLSPLRQQADAEAAGGHHLYTPSTGYRVSQGLGGPVGPTTTGQNKPPGVAIDYVVGAAPEGTEAEEGSDSGVASEGIRLVLEILDAEGAVIRTLTTDTAMTATGVRYARAPAAPGHNRVFWDLRVESGPRVTESYAFFGDAQGYRVMPGTYGARLTVGDAPPQTRSFEVRGDPRIPASQTDFAANGRFLESVFGAVVNLHIGLNDIRDVRAQVNAVVGQAAEAGLSGAEALEAAGMTLADSITVLEDRLFQKRRAAQQDMVAYEALLNMQLTSLMGEVDGSDLPPRAGVLERWGDLEAEWIVEEAALSRVLGEMLDAFNQLARDSGVPAVITRGRPRAVS